MPLPWWLIVNGLFERFRIFRVGRVERMLLGIFLSEGKVVVLVSKVKNEYVSNYPTHQKPKP